MFGFRLAPDAKYWRHLWSVQLMAVSAAFSGVASVLGAFGGLPWVQHHPFTFCGIAAGVNIMAIVGRLVDQPGVPNQ